MVEAMFFKHRFPASGVGSRPPKLGYDVRGLEYPPWLLHLLEDAGVRVILPNVTRPDRGRPWGCAVIGIYSQPL